MSRPAMGMLLMLDPITYLQRAVTAVTSCDRNLNASPLSHDVNIGCFHHMGAIRTNLCMMKNILNIASTE
jgi:hypothetical protein